jgi:hypothetical protein
MPKNREFFKEDKDSPYVNVIVSREDNKTSEKVKNFVKAYESDEVEKSRRNFQRRSCKRLELFGELSMSEFFIMLQNHIHIDYQRSSLLYILALFHIF